ncbi:MAG: histidine phosphatase family protein [Sphingobacteriia bacterium]|nr:histidine phosphatase family protein [Sphingobacteriia bacterium]NCC39833.1 histidine phosphatase family protein [Gammaproteobacteria bacterium]
MPDRFIDLLRHGETLGGPGFRGARDDPLSAHGRASMHRVAGARPGWTRIVSSPARRCGDFARALATQQGVPLSFAPALRERGFGDWEGLAAEQIPAAERARFWADPVGYTPPGAESFQAFSTRVLAAWAELRASPAPATLVVTHGGVIRVILAELLRMPPAAVLLIEVPPASLSCLRLPEPPGLPSLMSHGIR